MIPEKTTGAFRIRFDNRFHIQMRKCGDHAMWGILLDTGKGAWKSMCWAASATPPFLWIHRFIGSGLANNIEAFRSMLLRG
jgi:hypothetical protein